jgi:Domain of unknown function (DUF4272)
MSILINAYCTHLDPPKPQFPHALSAQRDCNDPELSQHLDGFIGYVVSRGEQRMTQVKYHLMRHIQRVKHHYSLTIDDGDLDAFAEWAWQANAICFLPDGSIRDPSGRILIDGAGADQEAGAEVPYPPDARERKARSERELERLGIRTPASLPPVIGEAEVELRPALEVAQRALALFVVAVRAESLAAGNEIPVAELEGKRPLAFGALTPNELLFLNAAAPDQQQTVNFAWRYEALFLLQWALGLAPDLPHPSGICDVSAVARAMLDLSEEELLAGADLRPLGAVLDALDLHFRLHWMVRQARLDGKDGANGVDPGVIQERHHALNWLVRFEGADWDDVDTPT